MKSFTKILKEMGNYIGPGHPQGPNAGNEHHFNKHPRTKKTQHYPFGSQTFPYVDDDIDIEVGDEAAEMASENFSIQELFKFKTQARDNTTLPSHDAQGTGPASVYGKGLRDYGSLDPDVDNTTDEKEKKRREVVDSRMQNKVRPIESKELSLKEFVGSNLRSRHPRDPNDYSTKQPFKNGLPRERQPWDQETELDKEEELIEKWLAKEANFAKAKHMSAMDSFSNLQAKRRATREKSDLDFWEKLKNYNSYLMNQEEDFEEV